MATAESPRRGANSVILHPKRPTFARACHRCVEVQRDPGPSALRLPPPDPHATTWPAVATRWVTEVMVAQPNQLGGRDAGRDVEGSTFPSQGHRAWTHSHAPESAAAAAETGAAISIAQWSLPKFWAKLSVAERKRQLVGPGSHGTFEYLEGTRTGYGPRRSPQPRNNSSASQLREPARRNEWLPQ